MDEKRNKPASAQPQKILRKLPRKLITVGIVTVSALSIGCQTLQLTRVEFDEANGKSTSPTVMRSLPVKYVMDLVPSASDKFAVKISRIDSRSSEWDEAVKKVNIYTKACKGYYSTTDCEFNTKAFFLLHLLLVGFVYDLTIPFTEYTPSHYPFEIREPTNETEGRHRQSIVAQSPEPVKNGSAILNIDGHLLKSVVVDGLASWALPDRLANSPVSSAAVEYGGQSFDVRPGIESALKAMVKGRELQNALTFERTVVERAKKVKATHVLVNWLGCRTQLDRTLICETIFACTLDRYREVLENSGAEKSHDEWSAALQSACLDIQDQQFREVVLVPKRDGSWTSNETFFGSGRRFVKRVENSTLTNGFGASLPAATWVEVGNAPWTNVVAH